MKKQWTEQTMNAAIGMFIKGEKIKNITKATSISQGTLVKRLNDLTCRHPLCTQGHPCRAAIRRYGGTMMCSALKNTNFGKEFCPFFKTEEDFKYEYKMTNQLDPDPYELYTREIVIEEDWI